MEYIISPSLSNSAAHFSFWNLQLVELIFTFNQNINVCLLERYINEQWFQSLGLNNKSEWEMLEN
jgi:hypothetical protein